MAYTKTVWVNGGVPAINATNLNHLEQGIFDTDASLTTNIANLATTNATVANLIVTRDYKNWIINGGFEVWQRATTQSTNGYGSDDRFFNANVGSTKVHSRVAFTVGQTTVPSNPTYYSSTVVTSVAGASNYVAKQHAIEDVTKLAGKTVTLSFWAKANANKNISTEFIQNFGTGGSTAITGLNPTKTAITSTWSRITLTVTLPSVTGKTIGVGNFTGLNIYFDAGSSFNARTNTLGQQSGTFDIANIVLIEGGVAVEYKMQSYADVLRECQRYFFIGGAGFYGVFSTASIARFNAIYPVPMRIEPTISASSVPVATIPAVSDGQNGSQTTDFLESGVGGIKTILSASKIQIGGFSGSADGKATILNNACLSFSAEL